MFVESLIFFGVGGFSLYAYALLQLLVLVTTKRVWRIFASLPIPFVICLLYVTKNAYDSASNLWPILLIFLMPAVLLYLLLIAILYWIFGGGNQQIKSEQSQD